MEGDCESLGGPLGYRFLAKLGPLKNRDTFEIVPSFSALAFNPSREVTHGAVSRKAWASPQLRISLRESSGFAGTLRNRVTVFWLDGELRRWDNFRSLRKFGEFREPRDFGKFTEFE